MNNAFPNDQQKSSLSAVHATLTHGWQVTTRKDMLSDEVRRSAVCLVPLIGLCNCLQEHKQRLSKLGFMMMSPTTQRKLLGVTGAIFERCPQACANSGHCMQHAVLDLFETTSEANYCMCKISEHRFLYDSPRTMAASWPGPCKGIHQQR